MKNKIHKILVTGGAGFIGSHLVDELLKRGFFVRVIDNLSNGSKKNLEQCISNKKFEFIKGDILNIKDCQQALSGIDIVYHLVCLGVRHSIHSPFENHRVNAEGTLKILGLAKKNKVKKFFYISSSEIYGAAKEFPISEETAPHPLTVYGASKLAGENYAIAYNKCFGLNVTVCRFFNNFGERAHFEGDAGELIPRSIVRILQKKQPIIFGNGENTRDFLYVKDTARIMVDLIGMRNISGEIFNIGFGKEIKIKEVIQTILKLMGKTNLKIKYLKSRPADVPRLWVDTSKFWNITGLKAKYSFEEGLTETIKFYKNLFNQKKLNKGMTIYNWK